MHRQYHTLCSCVLTRPMACEIMAFAKRDAKRVCTLIWLIQNYGHMITKILVSAIWGPGHYCSCHLRHNSAQT